MVSHFMLEGFAVQPASSFSQKNAKDKHRNQAHNHKGRMCKYIYSVEQAKAHQGEKCQHHRNQAIGCGGPLGARRIFVGRGGRCFHSSKMFWQLRSPGFGPQVNSLLARA